MRSFEIDIINKNVLIFLDWSTKKVVLNISISELWNKKKYWRQQIQIRFYFKTQLADINVIQAQAFILYCNIKAINSDTWILTFFFFDIGLDTSQRNLKIIGQNIRFFEVSQKY